MSCQNTAYFDWRRYLCVKVSIAKKKSHMRFSYQDDYGVKINLAERWHTVPKPSREMAHCNKT